MAYLDTSDHDDRTGDGTDRRSQAARPAWDAATYGTPEDLRRSRPPARGSGRPGRGRGGSAGGSGDRPNREGDRGYDDSGRAYRDADDVPPRYPAAEPYPGDPYPGEPYPAETYPPSSGSYPADAYSPYAAEPTGYTPARTADPYPDRYASDPFAAESYAASQSYAAGHHSFAADPVEADRFRAEITYEGPDDYSDSDYPGGVDHDERAPQPSKAGRNLPAAIGVGVLLGGVAVGSLFVWRPAFLGVVAIAIGIGIWELVRAIRTSGVNPPLIPLVVGGALMTGLGWWGQADALTFGLFVTVLAVMIWRLADGALGYGRDVTAATLVAVYVPFLAGFAALLASPDDGGLRVLVTLACVVLSDTGGYIAGVLFGKHPMAPSVSPKKSWEGLVGSLVATGVGGALLLSLAFDVALPLGALFGLAIAAASVVGDLGESMIKRDLGVKDMSNLLPGHGGLMDRLDSIVFAAPTAYALLILLAPPL